MPSTHAVLVGGSHWLGATRGGDMCPRDIVDRSLGRTVRAPVLGSRFLPSRRLWVPLLKGLQVFGYTGPNLEVPFNGVVSPTTATDCNCAMSWIDSNVRP